MLLRNCEWKRARLYIGRHVTYAASYAGFPRAGFLQQCVVLEVDLSILVGHWNSGQTAADKAKLCTEMYWEVMCGLGHKIGNLKTPISNNNQTVADGTMEQHIELIVVVVVMKS